MGHRMVERSLEMLGFEVLWFREHSTGREEKGREEHTNEMSRGPGG